MEGLGHFHLPGILVSGTDTIYKWFRHVVYPLPWSLKLNYARISLQLQLIHKEQLIRADAFPGVNIIQTQVERSTSSFWNCFTENVVWGWSELMFSFPWRQSLHTGWRKHHLNLCVPPATPEAWPMRWELPEEGLYAYLHISLSLSPLLQRSRKPLLRWPLSSFWVSEKMYENSPQTKQWTCIKQEINLFC